MRAAEEAAVRAEEERRAELQRVGGSARMRLCFLSEGGEGHTPNPNP